jgi:hypothetical protein
LADKWLENKFKETKKKLKQLKERQAAGEGGLKEEWEDIRVFCSKQEPFHHTAVCGNRGHECSYSDCPQIFD